MRKYTILVAIVVFFGLMFIGCSSDNPVQPTADQIVLEKKPVEPPTGQGSFTLEAKYTYVRSYPGGGGVYLLRIVPGPDLEGDVALSVSANKYLGAQLTSAVVNSAATIAELTLSPTRQVVLATHIITVTASNQTHEESVELEVEVVNWGIGSMSIAQDKQNEFVAWMQGEHPELGNFNNQQWDIYGTYPQIMIVEHYTFLSDDWEFRICFHVMIPPYDWSKMWLRPRGEWDAILAAIREWDDDLQDYVIHEMPVEEYPIISGY